MIVWIVFIVCILLFLALDLGVFNKDAHIIKTKEASVWTGIWVSVALSFSLVIFWLYKNNMVENIHGISAQEAALKYITGYLIELSLSIDNIFVIAVIFKSFRIPQKYQHRVLFWGIMGAIFFRAVMILFGVILIEKFTWTTYVFGVFLLYTAFKMLWSDEDNAEGFDPKGSWVYRFTRRFVPVTSHMSGEHFFIKKRNLHIATPLFIALIVIEVTDIIFALDSIPAILAITSEPFLVFSSNILAIMGLRSMYFFLANMLERFHHLKYSLLVILSFVGVKMLLVHHFKFPEWFSLAFILVALVAGVVVSLISVKEPVREK
ncbi:MAG: TerC family protein [Bacteroidia bacterium]|nr:TerC family protein [Bacteroidia bacterium]